MSKKEKDVSRPVNDMPFGKDRNLDCLHVVFIYKMQSVDSAYIYL